MSCSVLPLKVPISLHLVLFRKSGAAEALIKGLQFPEKNPVFEFWYIPIFNASACDCKFLTVQKRDLGIFS